MTNIDLIKQNLPEQLRNKAQEFNIPDDFLTKTPNIIVLILNSKSMDSAQEKQSWFNLLPLMTQQQLDKLNDILTREKQKLEEIEQKYEQKKDDLKKKYEEKREAVWYEKKMADVKQKWDINQQQEQKEADSLLTQI